ncbi:MAG: hypothetical protein ACXAEU_17110 [Candidatus Hodarchaeales archaeon]|jgi:hypothetical protein
MDKFLSEYYGTNSGQEEATASYDEEAIEKMAQLTLLEKEASEEGVDLSQLSEEEILSLADELYSAKEEAPAQEIEKEAQEKEAQEKEAQDMFEAADYSGRVMAHAMVQELNNIQKEAESKSGMLGKAYKATLGRVGSAVEGRALKNADAYNAKKIKKTMLKDPTASPSDIAKNVAEKTFKKARAKRIGAEAATATAGLGALGAGGYGAHKLLKKKESSDSAFDTLVQQRALEHLIDAGYVDKEGNVYEPEQSEQQKTASDFNSVVDQAALTYLSELGYPIE